MINTDLHIESLSIGYKLGEPLLENINLDCVENSFVGLVGANGSGKSTLVKTISKSLEPLAGSIHLNGKNISTLSKNQLAQQITYIPSSQQYAVGISVFDLLSFARTPYLSWTQKLSQEELNLIAESAKKVGIADLINSRYHELSEGQKQLVNIAKALVQETNIIILDEPTAHLDIVNKIRVFELLKQLSKEGKTVICISHDVHTIFPYLDQILVLTKSQKLEDYSPQEIKTEALLELLF